MRAPHLLILLAAGLLMTSCAAPTSTSGASASSVTAGGLAGSRWMLDELGGQPPLDGSVITANFSDDGAVTGTSGCNRYRAGVTINGDAIQVDEAIASTLMACDEALMAQEGAYLAALVAARTFTISGETLTLKDAGGASLSTFVAESQELAGTSWQVTAYNNGQEQKKAAEKASQQAEANVKGRQRRLEFKLRLQTGKVAGAEIATEQSQRRPGDCVAQCDAENAADQSDQGTFGQQPAHQAGALEAERSQEGKLAAPFDDGERLRREDQEGTCQQRNRRQHAEIDPVRPAQVIRLLTGRCRRFNQDARREMLPKSLLQAFRGTRRGNGQVNA